ncbi:MAG: rod shape-determining protein MreC [Rikenellaceae bacterium]
MYKLIEFIRSIYIFLLFAAMEGVALYVYTTSDSYAQAKVLSYGASVVGGVGSVATSVKDYFNLKSKNQELLERITDLEQSLAGYASLHRDSLLSAYSYLDEFGKQYQAAKVVSNSVNKQRNYLIINRGLQHDVRVGMAVITLKREVVGVVMECSDNFSVVMSVLNTSFRSSGELEDDRHAGSIYWGGESRYEMRMSELSKYSNIYLGARVVTTGFSHIFPEGILIGTISDYALDGHNNTYNANVALAADMSALNEVLVVNNNAYGEALQLEEGFGAEGLY